MEQAKFTYSPLEKALKKQRRTSEDQEEKQVKTTEEQGEKQIKQLKDRVEKKYRLKIQTKNQSILCFQKIF